MSAHTERSRQAMKAKERQKEILKMLIARRSMCMSNLAEELHVTLRTIVNDIAGLAKEYPITTARGNNGGVRIDDSYHPFRDSLSIEQTDTLNALLSRASDDEKRILMEIIKEFSSDGAELDRETL